jgi:hypothetical protein
MDAAVQCTICDCDSELEASPRWQRARRREQAEQIGFWWHSRRQVAQQLGVPDSSLRHCLQRHRQRCQASRFPRDVVEFCESPHGLEFLHRLLVAVHLVFVQANDAACATCGRFGTSGLDEFLPTSYGVTKPCGADGSGWSNSAGRKRASGHPHATAANQPAKTNVIPRSVWWPSSRSQFAARTVRPAPDLEPLLDERLGWSVTILSPAMRPRPDRPRRNARRIIRPTCSMCTVQATSLVLAGATRRAHEAATAAERQTAQRREELAACQQQCPQSAHVTELQQQVEQATAAEAAARQQLAVCQQRQQQATEARHGLSHDYHPMDLETGRPIEAEEVTRRLRGHFNRLDEIASEVDCRPRAEKLAKARRVACASSTIAF